MERGGTPSSPGTQDLHHALRNAMASTLLSLSMAQRALDRADRDQVATCVDEARSACEQACALLAATAPQDGGGTPA